MQCVKSTNLWNDGNRHYCNIIYSSSSTVFHFPFLLFWQNKFSRNILLLEENMSHSIQSTKTAIATCWTCYWIAAFHLIASYPIDGRPEHGAVQFVPAGGNINAEQLRSKILCNFQQHWHGSMSARKACQQHLQIFRSNRNECNSTTDCDVRKGITSLSVYDCEQCSLSMLFESRYLCVVTVAIIAEDNKYK